jgi:zinc transport system ATP-binding protein
VRAPVLAMQGVSYAYDGEDVLTDVTIAVEAGDFVAILGPNGSGKSTLVKLAVGLLSPRCGTIMLRNADGSSLKGKQIGYVAQNPLRVNHAFPATVREIVAMGRTAAKGLFSRFKKSDRHIVQHVLELVGMWECRERLIGELSGGQQQRVYVARALAANPEILILDEPTTGVDAKARDQLYALLSALNKNLGVTVILVSHDIERVLRHAKTAACVNGGIIYYGSAFDIKSIKDAMRYDWLYTETQVKTDV